MATKNARKTDPLTSMEAAERHSDTASPIADWLLAAYATAGASGLTAEEAADRLPYLDLKDGSWKRVSDLKRDGLIVPINGKTRTTRAGRKAQVLHISPEGRRILREVLKGLRIATGKAA